LSNYARTSSAVTSIASAGVMTGNSCTAMILATASVNSRRKISLS
jgi:hypothetical protein